MGKTDEQLDALLDDMDREAAAAMVPTARKNSPDFRAVYGDGVAADVIGNVFKPRVAKIHNRGRLGRLKKVSLSLAKETRNAWTQVEGSMLREAAQHPGLKGNFNPEDYRLLLGTYKADGSGKREPKVEIVTKSHWTEIATERNNRLVTAREERKRRGTLTPSEQANADAAQGLC